MLTSIRCRDCGYQVTEVVDLHGIATPDSGFGHDLMLTGMWYSADMAEQSNYC